MPAADQPTPASTENPEEGEATIHKPAVGPTLWKLYGELLCICLEEYRDQLKAAVIQPGQPLHEAESASAAASGTTSAKTTARSRKAAPITATQQLNQNEQCR